jgi:hypothetical protein
VKKFFLLMGLMLSVAAISDASVKAPKDVNGNSLATIDFVGADTCRLTVSDTNVAKSCFVGPGLVFGVGFTGTNTTNYVVIADSITTTGTTLMNVLAETSEVDEGILTTLFHSFPAPMKFATGLYIRANATIDVAGEIVVFYRKLSATD